MDFDFEVDGRVLDGLSASFISFFIVFPISESACFCDFPFIVGFWIAGALCPAGSGSDSTWMRPCGVLGPRCVSTGVARQ